MDPAWLATIISGAGMLVTVATVLISIGRAQRAGEAKATEAAAHAEQVALAQGHNTEAVVLAKLEAVFGKLTSEVRDMREKFSVELAVLKRDLDRGRDDFKQLHEKGAQVDDRLRQVELEIAVWRKHTGTVTAPEKRGT